MNRNSGSDEAPSQFDELVQYIKNAGAFDRLKDLPRASQFLWATIPLQVRQEFAAYALVDRRLLLGEGKDWLIWAYIFNHKKMKIRVEDAASRKIDCSDFSQYPMKFPFSVFNRKKDITNLTFLVKCYFLQSGLVQHIFPESSQKRYFQQIVRILYRVDMVNRSRTAGTAVAPIHRRLYDLARPSEEDEESTESEGQEDREQNQDQEEEQEEWEEWEGFQNEIAHELEEEEEEMQEGYPQNVNESSAAHDPAGEFHDAPTLSGTKRKASTYPKRLEYVEEKKKEKRLKLEELNDVEKRRSELQSRIKELQEEIDNEVDNIPMEDLLRNLKGPTFEG
ncbi:hypothetical protein EJ04DRAFT_519860 [Polyplosphaeria fusca]|uniref:Uncharacterized protein n=1 Tax=Polyplosphaeria fusca TaxID=682080 RepID=A0A9P4R408_9PLEO|nr:hypothetical protein EJ04DRAFT_519860 [Polyplosphaeria fusca]